MNESMNSRIRSVQVTAIFSMLFALIGFSYNVWRMEATEDNNNSRSACFELLLQLAELEQLVYSAHYDKNPEEGNPRKGWVKVGLVVDLSTITTHVNQPALGLRESWAAHWETMPDDEAAAQNIFKAIDQTRSAVQTELKMLD